MGNQRKDTWAYLRKLEGLGYGFKRTGKDHIAIIWHGQVVTTASGSAGAGRGLANLRATVRRFERQHGIIREGRTV